MRKFSKTLHRNARGFTLIELLVVIAVIGVLASVVLLALNQARIKSRDAKRIGDVREIMVALEQYYNDNSSYPPDLSSLTPNYLAPAPTAPVPVDGTCTAAQNIYRYTQLNSGTDYTLTFCLGQGAGALGAGTHTGSPEGMN